MGKGEAMSKFDGILSEAAYAVSGHGFTEDVFGTVEDSYGYNALVSVNGNVLQFIDEDELRDRYLAEYSPYEPAGLLVWIREDSQGFVTAVEFGSDSGLRSGIDFVNRAWDAWVEYVSENSDDDCTCGHPDCGAC